MNRKNPEVDGYLRKLKKWQKELTKLRAIILDRGLTEELKWRAPCYTFQESNVVIMQGFKEYCALMFFKGALLKDFKGILVRPGENTQAGRQIRFGDVREIVALQRTVKDYIDEAIEIEKAGLKVKLNKSTDFAVPEELQTKFDELPALNTAFEALTPGRQRAYALYFSAAKQAKTRAARVEKCVRQILAGKGLND